MRKVMNTMVIKKDDRVAINPEELAETSEENNPIQTKAIIIETLHIIEKMNEDKIIDA